VISYATERAVFTDKIEAKDFPKMPKEYQDLLVRVLRIQADCEIGGPHVYFDRWLLGASNADEQWKVSKTISEEIDHFRKINGILLELGFDASDRLFVPKRERYLEAFRHEMPTWAEWAAFGFLIDRVGQYQLEEFQECTYGPLERLLPPYNTQILDEERGHIHYGTLKVMELCKTPESKEQVQKAINKWYIVALDMFGKSDSWRDDRYLEWGLKRRTNFEARAQYIAEVNPWIHKLGLTVPDPLVGRSYL
jgi:ring-1,2-phenylacetyl-CoA epoxidase subunit PaaA